MCSVPVETSGGCSVPENPESETGRVTAALSRAAPGEYREVGPPDESRLAVVAAVSGSHFSIRPLSHLSVPLQALTISHHTPPSPHTRHGRSGASACTSPRRLRRRTDWPSVRRPIDTPPDQPARQATPPAAPPRHAATPPLGKPAPARATAGAQRSAAHGQQQQWRRRRRIGQPLVTCGRRGGDTALPHEQKAGTTACKASAPRNS